jgi:hypothetical protein
LEFGGCCEVIGPIVMSHKPTGSRMFEEELCVVAALGDRRCVGGDEPREGQVGHGAHYSKILLEIGC